MEILISDDVDDLSKPHTLNDLERLTRNLVFILLMLMFCQLFSLLTHVLSFENKKFGVLQQNTGVKDSVHNLNTQCDAGTHGLERSAHAHIRFKI